ncbi:hypothetical protein EU805_11375 [Salipiger sp. IMCC34102]|uniref:hypothetical protein n=1 Tax=Salipiger sp. IMCC34102 TaxID=2510647 RepID=UPI00101D40FF|nr:hypothetical protein [Salipiger sp. IMCC34102]RYH01793.1 hypothetical protein EU805_11375 [Salipiger sp. IMCC34102]
MPGPASFNIMIVGQKGRLQYEALLLAASLRENDPGFTGRLIVAEPQPGPLWPEDPRIDPEIAEALTELGAEVTPFDSRVFGADYPYGNKIEGLAALPPGEPFLFLDTDTLVMGPLSDLPFDFDRPSASMRREGTWPVEEVYWPGYTAIWKSLYDRFGLDFDSSIDLSQPDEYWARYLYFNAGWFFGADPGVFGQRFLSMAQSIRDDPPEELAIQPLDPWLDQVALPLVIHSLGGGRPGPELDGLDGDITCHWRVLPLLYARESDRVVRTLEAVAAPNRIKKHLKKYDPFKRMIYQARGHKVRDLFDRDDLPRKEQQIRNRIKSKNLWLR